MPILTTRESLTAIDRRAGAGEDVDRLAPLLGGDDDGGVVALDAAVALGQRVRVGRLGADREAALREAGERADEVVGHAAHDLGAHEHGVHVPGRVVVGEDRAPDVVIAARRLQVARGREDRVHGVVRVLEAVAVGVHAVLLPGGRHELHPAQRAGGGDVEVAAVNEIETDYGRNLNVSSAGALGWMQFMPATWKQYGVDANHDGLKDPYNPVDAIFAAARYLKAAGGDHDIRGAIFAYNHADWYVDSVLHARAGHRRPAVRPGRLAHRPHRGPLPGRRQGHLRRRADQARAPQARAQRRDRRRRPARPQRRSRSSPRPARRCRGQRRAGRARSAQPAPRATSSRSRTPTATRTRTATSARSPSPTRRPSRSSAHRRRSQPQLKPPRPTPRRRAPAGRRRAAPTARPRDARTATPTAAPSAAPPKERLFAHPARRRAPRRRRAAGVPAHGPHRRAPPLGLDPRGLRGQACARALAAPRRHGPRPHRQDRRQRAPHLRFEIRPAGRGAPRIDPKPILDGWKLLESTAIYRAKGKNPFVRPGRRRRRRSARSC